MKAVFLREPGINAEDLVAVFAAAGFRTAVDARNAVARAAGGVVVDDADDVAAERLCDAFHHRGYAASVVDATLLALPPLQRTKELVVATDHIDVADALGRLTPLPLEKILLIAAIKARIVTTQPVKHQPAPTPGAAMQAARAATSMVLPGAQTAAKLMKALGGTQSAPSTAMVEAEEVFLELVTAERRLRLDESGVVLRTGGPKSLAELTHWLDAALPPTTLRQRGIAPLGRGEAPPRLKNLREFEREVSWALWRAQHSS